MSESISSPSNPLVKQVRTLHNKKARQKTGLFLVEGIQLIGEAIEAGWGLEALVYAPDLLTSDFALRLVENQSQRGLRCVALPTHLFDSLAGKENPQGLLAIARQRSIPLEQLGSKYIRLAVAVVSPQDPGNVGTILRTMDAVGAGALFLLDGGVEPYHPTLVRASMGAIFWIPMVSASFHDFIKWKEDNGVWLVGSSARIGSPYQELCGKSKPLILLLGNEQKGLSEEHFSACDQVFSLPMQGRLSSLNLAVAAGILLYKLLENKRGRSECAP
jgi:TrmH family RNA methyltransferase